MTPPAGYSTRPLAAKLGLKPGMRVALVNAPADYLTALGPVAEQLEICDPAATELDVIQLFVTEQSTLTERLPTLVAALAPHGALWMCWPKQAARLPTDLREEAVRAAGLATGLVDVKVAAIDASWSGLKFVRRLRDRAQ
ncbi:MAG TPA: hypothetical protein VFN78_13920 [Ktedonobacterales bacterium]|nr:hypothetical protein [Ktedonobacterales bacterium]